MKEIKFRVWDNDLEIMSYSDTDIFITFSDDGIYVGYEIDDEIDDYELMQYVGCKDRNNKEIYEGDIVKTKEHIGQIIFSKGMFFIDVKGDFYLPIYNVSEFMEVIGNIYENPDLLD